MMKPLAKREFRISLMCFHAILFLLESSLGNDTDELQRIVVKRASSNCTGEFFACSSGECVDRSVVCDNVKNCPDGSDETRECCTLPQPSAGRKYVVSCPLEMNCSHRAGANVPKYTEISVSCSTNYANVEKESSFSICSANRWLPPVMNCQKLCQPLRKKNMDLVCFRNKVEIKCEDNMVAGTIVRPRCAPAYHPEVDVHHREINCLADGTWDNLLFSCVPDCGKQRSRAITLIARGRAEKYGDSPWNVAIYDVSKEKKVIICGGTIVTSELIVSAAHCFYQEEFQRAYDASRYEAVVSKITSNYTIKDNGQTKIYKIREILIHDKFYGMASKQESDIAILRLAESMVFNNVVLPACVQKISPYPFNPGEEALGKIVGWGYNEKNETPTILMTADLPYISQSRCRNMVSEIYRNFVTSDKFCAGEKSGPILQPGDSGYGLVFRDQNTGLYYLRGVSSGRDNANKHIASFIDVGQYAAWIDETDKRVKDEIREAESTVGQRAIEIEDDESSLAKECSETAVFTEIHGGIKCKLDD